MSAATLPFATRQRLARQLAGDDQPPAEPAALIVPADQIGLIASHWPGISEALWLRAGGSDAAHLTEAMQHAIPRLKLDFTPFRIIEIGAGCGYRSVALAHAFPGATIASVEPFPANARLHALNTLPWRRIIGLRTAITAHPTRFTAIADPATGIPALRPDSEGDIGSMSLSDLHRLLGWDHADLLLIDQRVCPDLDDPDITAGFAGTRLVALRRTGEDTETIIRHDVPSATHGHPRPVFDLGGPPMKMSRHNIAPDAWAFFPIGDTGFRLHPNPHGQQPPRLVLHITLAGERQLETQLRVNHEAANPVRFRITVTCETGIIATGETILPANAQQMVTLDLPPINAPATVEFSTEMAHAQSNGFAWAEVLGSGIR